MKIAAEINMDNADWDLEGPAQAVAVLPHVKTHSK